MCYCTPNIRTPQCISCVPYLAHKVEGLEHQNKKLIEMLTEQSHLKKPAPIIFCNDCPNINRDMLKDAKVRLSLESDLIV